jgi:hypothetical protein
MRFAQRLYDDQIVVIWQELQSGGLICRWGKIYVGFINDDNALES